MKTVRFPKLTLVFLTLVLAGLWIGFSQTGQAAPAVQEAPPVIAATYRGVITAAQFDISPALRDIAPLQAEALAGWEDGDRPSGLEGPLGPQDIDPAVQSFTGPGEIPSPSVSFDGFSNVLGYTPPDPVGDVGPNHYVAMANVHFAIYDKSGALLYGPAANNTLWAGFGGACQNENSGDPIVLYDQLADRWLLTQFTSAGPIYYNCVALSTSGDPTGTYYRWAFSTGTNFPDYPKYGVWPNAYFVSTREYAGGASFAGIGAYALNRAQMIAGNPSPIVISFLATPAVGYYNIGDGLLPSDLDGFTLPPDGSPNYFMGSMDNGGPYGAPNDALTLWKFDANFVTPASSSFLLANTLLTDPFDSMFPCSPGSRDCIPQPGTSEKIDILSYRQRPLHRLAYRNFGDHESLVTNQSVEAAANIAGVRWYEVRSPNASPVIYQQGTYAPGVADTIHRWMGSIAMDSAGNIGLGYSASDATSTYPSVWYTGRLAGDPLGTLPQGEGSIVNGGGSQLSTGSRWGDYTSMNVDPVDDCTFWYINEYYPATSTTAWRLRIGSFKFDECSSAPDLALDKSAAAVVLPGEQITYTLAITNFGPGAANAISVTTAITDTSPITIPASGAATPYPAEMFFTFPAPGRVAKVAVTIFDINHTYPDDLDVLLVAPDGEMTLLMSDAGGENNIANVTLTFDDDAAATLPDSAVITSGAFQPANYIPDDSFPAPAPAGPYTASMANLIGADPRGAWSLFAFDDAAGDDGSFAGGWSLTLWITREVTLLDQLPDGFTFVSGFAPGWDCQVVGQLIACTISSLPVGPAPAIEIVATAPMAIGAVINTAEIFNTAEDPNPANNVDGAATLVDTPPVAVDDDYSLDEDTVLQVASPGVLGNDVDPDGLLLASLFSPPANGAVDLHLNGSFTYTPTENFNGSDQFTYLVFDGYLTATATVDLTIAPVVDNPLVDAGVDLVASEGAVAQFSGSFTDPGRQLAAGEQIAWDFGDGSTATGVLTPTHIFADNGAYTVTLTITDTDGGVGSDALLATVENAAPVLGALADQEVAVGESFTVTAAIIDAGAFDSFTVEIVWALGVTETIHLPAGSLAFTAAHSYTESGNFTVQVTLTDKDGAVVYGEFTVEVVERKIYLPMILR